MQLYIPTCVSLSFLWLLMSYVHTILRQMACFMTSVVYLSGYVRVANYWTGYWQSKIAKFLYFMKNIIDYPFFFMSSYFKIFGGAWDIGLIAYVLSPNYEVSSTFALNII